MNSFSVFAGTDGCTSSTSGVIEIELIGRKSRFQLYASRLDISGANSTGPLAPTNSV